jgi:hypothetical protein
VLPFSFSVDDLFVVGSSFDLLGGYLLGRGLLASAEEVATLTTQAPQMDGKINAFQAVAQIEAWADAIGGLVSLACGFVLQAGGYVALIAGAALNTGGPRAMTSLFLGVFAAGLAFLAFRRARWRLILPRTVRVARANPWTGEMDEDPDGVTLYALGQRLGFWTIGSTAVGAPDLAGYAREHFGVERVAQRLPIQVPAPGRR